MYREDVDIVATNGLLRKSFLNMFIGLLVTISVPAFILSTNNVKMLQMIQTAYLPLIIAEFIVVIYLSARLEKLSIGTCKILFFGYALLNGFVFSLFTMIFPIGILLYALAITSTLFLVMALYGYTTHEDLSKYGNILKGALITMIILSLLNMFLGVPALYWMISVFGVVLFSVLIAYDVNRIKKLALSISEDEDENGDTMEKYGIMGALMLYLDFVNLFVYVLRIVGGKRD